MTLWKPICTVTLGSLALVGTALILPLATRGQQNMDRKNFIDSTNGQGISRTITTKGTFELNTLNNPFFRPLGTNGRTCATCHPTSQGMTISPDYASQVFDATQGLDPLFAAVDGANNPDADMSTPEARRSNCSMLLTKGLIGRHLRNGLVRATCSNSPRFLAFKAAAVPIFEDLVPD